MAHKVELALYDLSRGMAKALSMNFLGKQIDGIWHTGIIVYGKEYFFGGGLQSMRHDMFVAMHGGIAPNEVIELGATDLPEDVFEDFNREISPRFTPQTYDLLKHNCNNYTNEAAKFLLGKGIPEYIINLPNEVLESPMGGMLRPVLEQMTQQMNGADPYSGLQYQGQAQVNTNNSTASATALSTSSSITISTGTSTATSTATSSVAMPTPPSAAVGAGGDSDGGARSTPNVSTATAGSADATRSAGDAGDARGFRILDKHKRPLIGSDMAKAAASVAARLKALGSGDSGRLTAAEAAVLDALPSSLSAAKTVPVTPGSFPLMQKIIRKGSGWPEKAEFLTLVLLSLMVLHQYEGTDLENAMAEVFSRVEGSGDLSPQSVSIALCAAANTFGTPAGGRYMTRSDVLPGLQHSRNEVRQMSSALLNNVSLALAASVPKATADDAGDGEDGLSDEIVQLLLGVLENLHEETSQVVVLRRLLAAGRLIRRIGDPAMIVVKEVELSEEVECFWKSAPEGEAKGAASEVLRLLAEA